MGGAYQPMCSHRTLEDSLLKAGTPSNLLPSMLHVSKTAMPAKKREY